MRTLSRYTQLEKQLCRKLQDCKANYAHTITICGDRRRKRWQMNKEFYLCVDTEISTYNQISRLCASMSFTHLSSSPFISMGNWNKISGVTDIHHSWGLLWLIWNYADVLYMALSKKELEVSVKPQMFYWFSQSLGGTVVPWFWSSFSGNYEVWYSVHEFCCVAGV